MTNVIFPYGKRDWYPHMKPADVAIWNKFIEEFPDVYDNVQYDLEIGEVPGFVLNHPELAMQGQASNYQCKIDVVGFKKDQIDIIELKPGAGFAALGQVNGYKALYQRDFSPPFVPKAVVITDRTTTDISHAAHVQNVQIVVV
jgi:hypothetical protein